jgi:agmatine/peptidylarginine deiminase
MIRYPAEWENQESIIMVMPHKNSDWADNLQSAKSIFMKIASAICYKQKLILICNNTQETKEMFCYVNNIEFIELETNDTWIRDFGPITIYKDEKRELLDFQFNGWGGKYESKLDNQLTKKIFADALSYDFILEGGSIESDGKGTILTTTTCLLNKNRNKYLNKTEIEQKLKNTLGAKRILWLENLELKGDDTDSHIDMFARFIDFETIVYIEHLDIREQLEKFKTIDAKPYKLIPLPLPSPKYKNGNQLPASYANFLIINEAVLLPVYDDAHDKDVICLFKKIFPSREIIPINSLRLIEEGGGIHCSTMPLFSELS